MLIKKFILLFCIVLLAAVLRFFLLGSNPPSPTWDEVAWGYNAYSLGIDGRDEFGNFLPYKYLESFGDFKPPLYAYLTVVPIWIFGLNEFSVRFASAFFGTLTVLFTYFLVRNIFKEKGFSENLALLSSFLLAVSPWHINLSRAAFEANVATFFLVGGALCFILAINKNKWLLILSAISFSLSLYTFNTARIFAPLLVFILAFGFRKELLKIKRGVLIAFFVGLLFVLPISGFLFSNEASLRFREVNIFTDPSVVITANQEIENDNNSFWSRIIHNRRLSYSVQFVRHYLDNLTPDFLFIKGDGNPKFSTQNVGQLYLFELPFFIAGFFLIFRERRGNWWLVPLWLFLSILPAATARETPHALRIETSLPMFQIISAYGLLSFFLFIKKTSLRQSFKKEVVSLTALLFVINVAYYIHGYYFHYPREFSGEWQYGYKEAISFAEDMKGNYDQVAFTTHLGRPYIYYLFYSKLEPSDFRNNMEKNTNPFGFVSIESVGKYKFAEDLGQIAGRGESTLYINVPERAPERKRVLKTFYLLNGEPALIAYEALPEQESGRNNE